MVKAQEWLDKEYPESRKKHTKALIIKNKKVEKKLEGSLKIEGFTNLEELDCWDNLLTSLEVSNCPKIASICCSNNRLTNLNLTNLEKLASLNATSNRLSNENSTFLKNFANWKELHLDDADFSNEEEKQVPQIDQPTIQPKLTRQLSAISTSSSSSSATTGSIPLSPTPTLSSVFKFAGKGVREEKIQELTKKNEELTFELEGIKKELEREKQKNQLLQEKISFQNKFIQSREELIRNQKELIHTKDRLIDSLDNGSSLSHHNILLIGRTGSGKSALANVLSGTNNFKEKDGMVGETKNIQSECFEANEKRYRIIDTAGISDNTGLSDEEIFEKVVETVYSMKEGISQILFVTQGRFDQKEIDAYNLLRKTIFDEKITKYTTIVRTYSLSFDDNEWSKKERQEIIKSGGELFEVINSCNKIIYVNNGSLENRETSRKILLKHLATCWGNYRPQNLKELNMIIDEQMREKEKYQQREINLQKEIKSIEEKISKGEIKKDKGENILESKNKELVEVNQLEKMISININNNILQHMEEKGLGELWVEIIGKTFEKAIEIAPKCRIM